ncbi:MAG: flagellar hook protein FlgE [Pseudomonadota bacterium]
MSLFGVMRTSVSGLAAQAGRLAAVSDNVANTGTIGYKRSSVEFNTQVLDVNTGAYNSGSVSTVTRSEVGRQGAIRASTSETDLAISGSGFFVVQDAAGDFSLTRAGSFLVDSTGNLVNSAGQLLMGYDLSTTGVVPIANGFAGLSQINVGLLELTSEPSTDAELIPNLPANADIIAAGNLPSDNVAGSQSTGKTSMLLYDSLGNERIVDVYFAKTAADTWEITVFSNADSNAGSFPYASAPLAQQTVTFDPTTGSVTGGGSVNISFTVPGGETVDLDMTGISQLGTEYTVIAAQTNGSPPAAVDQIEVGSDGTIFGIYQNGNAIPIYQLALAKVPSPDKLNALPGNIYGVTIDSGDVLVGTAESDGYGSVLSGALEESNVDLATELTIMIESQRSYTANSRVFQTGSDLLDVLISL